MKSTSGSLHASHLFTIGVLHRLTRSRATRAEALAELSRYRDQGTDLQRIKEQAMATKKTRAHEAEPEVFGGQGIIYAVIDDREAMPEGQVSTVDIISYGIEAALDAGHETSEDIARYLTTSAFQHVQDKRVRFNSVLKAGDAVGAMMLRKLYNAYNELSVMADDTEDAAEKAAIRQEATGFAEALNIVLSPFSCEDPVDPRLVNWDEVDRITANFEKSQRHVIRERKGNPQ